MTEHSHQLDTPPRSREQAALDVAQQAIRKAASIFGDLEAEFDSQILTQLNAAEKRGIDEAPAGRKYAVTITERDWRYVNHAMSVLNKAQRDIAELLSKAEEKPA